MRYQKSFIHINYFYDIGESAPRGTILCRLIHGHLLNVNYCGSAEGADELCACRR